MLLQHAPRPEGQTFELLLQRELEYVAEQIAVAPRNESAWNYLWGLFKLEGGGPWEMGRHKEVREQGKGKGKGITQSIALLACVGANQCRLTRHE